MVSVPDKVTRLLTIPEPEPIRSAQTITLANVYEGLGDVQRLRANQVKRQTEKHKECLNEAKEWYQKSLDLWRSLEQQGKITDKDKATPGEINQKMAQSEAALAKLKVVR